MEHVDVLQYLKDVKSGKVSVIKTVKKILDEAKEINRDYHYFNVISDELALKQAKEIEKNPHGSLAGLPISVKDCICVKGVESTAGSKVLKGYLPVMNATAVQRCIDEGAIIIGKTSQDEFGFGSFATNVGIGFKVPKNPHDKSRVTGGSSGGAAGFAAMTKLPHVALAESTGGSIVNPASFCGVAGFCPTYGLVSRYGLIDYANSLDKIGVISKDVDSCELVADVIAGYDFKDSTSLDKGLNDGKVKKVALIKESLDVEPEVKDVILAKVNQLGYDYDTISMPLTFKYGIPTYYIIATSEASTNLAKFCGMRYGFSKPPKGSFDEYFSDVRSDAFGQEAKRRIMLGTFARMAGFRNAYYLKAMKLRTKIIWEYKKAFKEYDVLVSPTMPVVAPKFSDTDKLTPLQNYMMDVLTVGPNLAGMPHLSVNAGSIDKMPLGIMYTADHLSDKKLFTIAKF
jgi:aspartyl-tRNA(Asn)/glutamyl-tRNA(Gln) amidotransferase subunit A